MIVKYALSADEYVESRRAYRLRMARRRVLFRNLFGLAGLAIILGIYVRFSGFRWWADVLFLLAGGLLLEHLVLWRLRAAAACRSDLSLRQPVELKIDENNIVRTSTSGSDEIRWANILACHETRNLFLLLLQPDDLLVLPKRAFSPGDLFQFKELCKKELIVPTTRVNPDVVLLKFVVSWGLVAMAVIALFIGYLNKLIPQTPRTSQRARSSTAPRQPAAKSPPASPSELRGRGTVYLVPLGTIKSVSVPLLLDDLHKRYGLQLHLLPAIPPPAWAKNTARKQLVAEDLVTAMKLAYPSLAADPLAVMVGLTDEDMYISELNWGYAFSWREEERFAVVSSASLSEGAGDKPVTADVLQNRVRKVLVRDIGILHYRFQTSNSRSSILYGYVDEASELDRIGDDYLESDVLVRADLHVASGDPCFILRHYTAPEREHQELGEVTGCSGYYKELNLETVQIDLRYGLLLDQRTDFLIPDRIPLELTRVLRTQDSRSRAFGVGGNHNLNIFLVGDKWPFTWMDLILEHGGRSHFRRSNWGFGYWDARYTNRDVGESMYSGSTIDWAWPGWKLKNRNTTYEFPDPKGTGRPEQGSLLAIDGYNGSRLTLARDALGNLLRAHSPAGYVLTFKHDPENRVIEVDQENGGRFEYSYDASGHLARVKDADQRVTEYAYDEAGRMNRIVQNGAELCRLAYDAKGWLKSETLSGGRTYLFRYSVNGSGDISEVDISDSNGPERRIRLSPGEYTLDVLAESER